VRSPVPDKKKQSPTRLQRGAGQKKIDGPPRTLTKSQPTHPPSDFLFSLAFFFSRQVGKEVQKHHKNIFTKSPCRKKNPKFRQKISTSVFPRLFLFYRVFGCFSAMGVQKHYKKRFTKKIVSQSFYKKFDQKSKTDFFSKFILSRFWAFLDEGSSKTRPKKDRKNKSDPSPFSYFDPPTTGVTDFFFWRPLAATHRPNCTCPPAAP
jgi:hypothetical protein